MSNLLQIFGVPIYIGKIKSHMKLQKEFESFLEKDDYFSTPKDWDSNVDTSFGNPRNNELPWANFIQEVVNDHLGNFVSELNPKVETITKYQVWANRYQKGQYQETHNHATPDSHFSCNYIHKLPKESGQLFFVDKTHDFWEQTGLRRLFDVPIARKIAPKLEEGDIVIFPSFLEHYVTAHRAEDERVTFSANFFMQEKTNEWK